MALQIVVSAEMEAKLRERAAAAGQDVAACTSRLVQEAINAPSVDELPAPCRKQVAENDMGDDELDASYNGPSDEVWQERQSKPARSA